LLSNTVRVLLVLYLIRVCYPTKILRILQSASKILKTSNVIKNTLNSPALSLISLNYGVVVVKLRVWAVGKFGRLASEPLYFRH
jgi:hypothetical protein